MFKTFSLYSHTSKWKTEFIIRLYVEQEPSTKIVNLTSLGEVVLLLEWDQNGDYNASVYDHFGPALKQNSLGIKNT